MPQVVGENGRVKGLDAFFIEPALTAGTILGQLLKVRPAGHLRQRSRTGFSLSPTGFWQQMFQLSIYYTKHHLLITNVICVLQQLICTYSPDVTADHEANVLGERMNQLKQSRTRVRIAGQHQTLRPVNMEFIHRDTSLKFSSMSLYETFNFVFNNNYRVFW